MCVCVCVCVCQRKMKDRADVMREKVPIPLDGFRTCTSGLHAHRASDNTTRASTPCVNRNKHFGHSPTSSSVKHKHALQNTPTPVCMCVCVSQWEKVPDEWQARQATPAILQVSSSKHNAKKITRERGPFHQSIIAILTEEKREEKQFTKPTHVAVYLFRDLDWDRSRL